ncbi:LysR family transcriptional regulator [Verticiella sediminum]
MRSLQAFCALEECRQFTAAAKRCNVTQSAFSQMIGRLEEQVGMRLFDRDTRSVRLTAEGALFSIKAREILDHVARAMAEMHDYATKQHGRLAMAMVPSLAGSWAPALLDRYRAQYPGIALEIFDTYSERCLQLLRENKVDFAVTAQPGNPGEFLTRTLFEERFYLACAAAQAPKRSGQIALHRIRGLPVIHLVHTEGIRAISAGQMHQLRPLLRTAGAHDVGIEVEHAATLAGMVGQGLGFGVVPQSMANYFAGPAIVMLPIPRNDLRRPLFLIRRHWDSLPPAAAAFVELMQANLPAGASPATSNETASRER